MTDPRWTPAEQHVPHLLLELMHMGTADVGGHRIEQYKHSDTRRYLKLDHTGQAWQIAVEPTPASRQAAASTSTTRSITSPANQRPGGEPDVSRLERIENHELPDGRTVWCWGYVDGLPAFKYGWAPSGLATRAQLQTRRLRRSRGQDPVGVLVWRSVRFGDRTANLYRVDQAIPSRQMTPRQRASLTLAYLAHCTCRACGREVDGYLPTAVWRCSETCQ